MSTSHIAGKKCHQLVLQDEPRITMSRHEFFLTHQERDKSSDDAILLWHSPQHLFSLKVITNEEKFLALKTRSLIS